MQSANSSIYFIIGCCLIAQINVALFTVIDITSVSTERPFIVTPFNKQQVTMGSNQSKPQQNVPQTDEGKNTIASNESEATSTTNISTKNEMPKDSIHQNITPTTGGGCPMKKNDGGYIGGNLGGWFGGNGSGGNKKKEIVAAPAPTTAAEGGGCPVKHNNNKSNDNTQSNSGREGCPVKHNNNNNKSTEFNVYSQPIDPNNNMPSVANQLPSPFQTEKLPTTRVQSTIPKGGDSTTTWTYPSPQMFYNSLARKNKLGDTTESDIVSVVAMHNNMNEKTWAKVMQWEETLLGREDGQQSKLLKFMGRPSDLSPKAQLKHWIFGHPLPFDRHDWTVIRKDGSEVRYIIDYYHDESQASESLESAMPKLNDYNAVKSILVDVRPAVDDFKAVYGRAVTMPLARYFYNSTSFEPLPILPTNELKQQVGESQKVWSNIQKDVQDSKSKSMILKPEDIPKDQRGNNEDDDNEVSSSSQIHISEEEAKEVALSFAKMIGQCQKAQKVVDKCTDEAECAKASLALTMCLAKVVCPLQQNAVAETLNDESVDVNDEKAVEIYNVRFDKALENMAICVNAKSEQASIARQTHPHLFKDL